MEAQIVLNGVGGVEDGPAGRDDQDEAVESLRVEQTQIPVRSSARSSHLNNVGPCERYLGKSSQEKKFGKKRGPSVRAQLIARLPIVETATVCC